MTAPLGVSRVTAIDLVQPIADLYSDVETRLAADIARRLRAGMGQPDWAERKLAAAGELRQWTRVLLERAGRDTEDRLTQALLLAYVRGGDEAMRTLAKHQNTLPEWVDRAGINPGPRVQDALRGRRADLQAKLTEISRAFPGVGAVMNVVRSLTLRINGTHLPVLRWAEDTYRTVIAKAALPDVLLGVATRRVASQKAWGKLLDDGITGFTDRAGRNWNLASYVEMATRTGVAQAAVEGHLDRLGDAGLDLIIVSNAPQECERCRPWEGKVLERNGTSGRHTVQVENMVTGRMNSLEVAGSVDEAITKGLMHPNCRHSLNAYLHGATKIPKDTADPEGDAARQRLRELERKVRKEKLKAAAAIDPAAAKVHERKARAIQGQIREHVADTKHLGIFRKTEREQLNLGNTRGTGPAPARAMPKPRPTPPKPAAAQPPARAPLTGPDALAAAPKTMLRPDEITQAQRETVRAYRSSLYVNLNAILRRENGHIPDGWATEYFREATSELDQLMASSKLKADVVTYRGIADGAATFGPAWSQSLVGAEWTEHAYVSSSAKREVAERFRKPGGAILRLVIRRGTGAIQLSDETYEAELLSQRGLRLRVVSDRVVGGVREIGVEVLR